MAEYRASTYGERIADAYDDWVSTAQDTEGAVEFLSSLVSGGPILELGIGTGRVALPLAARGFEVHGIDASPSMIQKMRAKPGGERIPVTIGDFSEVPVHGNFSLIYVVFNTFFALLTQEAQVKCFQSCGQRLTADGLLVLESFVPDLGRFDHGQRTDTLAVGISSVRIDASTHDALNQRVHVQHLLIEQTGIRLYPVQLRYVWPSEMDLMARLGGLTLQNRFGGWHKEPFSNASLRHISVYRRDNL